MAGNESIVSEIINFDESVVMSGLEAYSTPNAVSYTHLILMHKSE